jgi:predicted RNA binding protein YcfA (HicA-like mRNA interferase family)
MPKQYPSRDIVRVLLSLGFQFISQKGSHGKFTNARGKTVIVPMNKPEVTIGTFKAILKQAGISDQEFKDLL